MRNECGAWVRGTIFNFAGINFNKMQLKSYSMHKYCAALIPSLCKISIWIIKRARCNMETVLMSQRRQFSHRGRVAADWANKDITSEHSAPVIKRNYVDMHVWCATSMALPAITVIIHRCFRSLRIPWMKADNVIYCILSRAFVCSEESSWCRSEHAPIQNIVISAWR